MGPAKTQFLKLNLIPDHGIYGEWSEWGSPEEQNDGTYKVTKTRECQNRWSPEEHPGTVYTLGQHTPARTLSTSGIKSRVLKLTFLT